MEENSKQEMISLNFNDTSEMDGKYLTFWTEQQLFAVPIADVLQIVQMQPITPIPEFPYYAKGIINMRGSIIPVVDVRLRFGKEEVPYSDHTCIIVTSIRNQMMGFIVDSVEEVSIIPDEEISQPPTMSHDTVQSFLTGIGKHDGRVILLLDTHKLLSDEQFETITEQIN